MNTIPENLQPWAAELSLIHSACWPFLGQLLPQLDGTVFRQQVGIEDVRSHPNGFDGIEPKGHLSRLLATEWALLDAFPEEFYRRALMAESQYLKQAYEKQRRPQSFYVLLDRGPDQYGAPLLVQLTFLLVLARRARLQHQPLRVGFIQNPGQWLIATPSTLAQNIHPYVSHARVVPEMFTAWRSVIEETNSSADSEFIDFQALWIAVSYQEAAPFGQNLLIAADSRTEQAKSVLDLLFKPSQKQLKVELPDEETAIRLIRRPFEQRIARAKPEGRAKPSESKLFEGISLTHFKLHPTARSCFFYDGKTLAMLIIPKKVVTNTARLRYEEWRPKHRLVGVWKRRNKMLTVEADETTLYCIGFFQQQHPITIALSQLNQQLPNPFTLPQKVQVPPLAYIMRAEQATAIIIRDGNNQGIMLKLHQRSGESGFVFDRAIALGKIKYESFSEYAFYYSAGGHSLCEMKPTYEQPKVIECDRPVQGLLQSYGYVDGEYRGALPLMKEDNGEWSKTLTSSHDCRAEENPIGLYRGQLIVLGGAQGGVSGGISGNAQRGVQKSVQRSDRQIWLYQSAYQSKSNRREPIPLIKEDNPIENAVYQRSNSWIVYRTAGCFKIYDLELKAEIMNLEAPTHAL